MKGDSGKMGWSCHRDRYYCTTGQAMDDSSRTRASSGHLIGNAAKIAGKKRVVLFDRENDSWHGDERSLNLHSQRAGRGPSWAQFQKEAEDRPTLLHTAQELSAGAGKPRNETRWRGKIIKINKMYKTQMQERNTPTRRWSTRQKGSRYKSDILLLSRCGTLSFLLFFFICNGRGSRTRKIVEIHKLFSYLTTKSYFGFMANLNKWMIWWLSSNLMMRRRRKKNNLGVTSFSKVDWVRVEYIRRKTGLPVRTQSRKGAGLQPFLFFYYSNGLK